MVGFFGNWLNRMASEEIWPADHPPSQPASGIRVVTSSLFAYVFVAISAYFVTRTTAEQVAGAEEGLVFNVVHMVAWLLAGIIGGFVAGYRSAHRGWIAGFLVGVLTIATVVGVLYLYAASEDITIADFLMLASTFEQVGFLALIALNIPVCIYGGMLGDKYFQENGHLEDPRKHTLFQVPWWHWIWLLIFLPSTLMLDLILSGHLLILGLKLTWMKLIRFDFSESLLLDLAPLIGLIATFYGVQNLWDALSIRTDLSKGRRVLKAFWGFTLMVPLVNSLWRVGSKLLVAAITGEGR